MTDQGLTLASGKSNTFTMTIPASNDGLVLRRRLDYLNNGVGGQTASIEVDSTPVGTWRIPGYYLNHLSAFPNLPASRSQGAPDKRWRDADFHIPAAVTSGKTQIAIKITNIGAGAWNAYDYRLFAYRSTPAPDTLPPAAPTGVSAVGQRTVPSH